jgi:hypothetical protein
VETTEAALRRVVDAAGMLVPQAVADFLPRAAPRMARRAYSFELLGTMLFALALTTIDGGVLSVYAKQTFDGTSPEGFLNLCVALLGAMDALANILSFVWLHAGQGRPKVPFVQALQAGVIACVAGIALLPQTSTGLVLLVFLALLARSCWSGILTVRPTIWRNTYPPAMRARIVGRFSTIQLIVVSLGGALLGRLLDADRTWYAPAIGAAGLLALFAVAATGRIRVRREGRLLRDERQGGLMRPWHGPAIVLRVLRQDRRYAQFQLCMTILGFANLMINPILAIALKEQFNLDFFAGILITSTLQQALQIISIPAWARLLDRSHVVRFRSIHSWMFSISGTLLLIGAIAHRVEFLYVAAGVLGLAYGGGSIAWHLGHVDFAPPGQTSQYMAAHVTLNGVRGLVAPLFAWALYEMFKRAGLNAAACVFGVSLAISVAGAWGFTALHRAMRAEMGLARRR